MRFLPCALEAAAVINLPADAKGTTTRESKTNFIKGAVEGSTVKAIAMPLHRGRRTQVWQTRLENDQGALIAMVTQACVARLSLSGSLAPQAPTRLVRQ
jgi:1,4-dihydroxy-2-naphthoyl-CoA hydrolase